MADLDVTVGVDVAAAEEGLRRLSAQFQREIGAIDRTKAEATAGLDITRFQKDIVKVKRELLELQEADADPEVHLDEKQFKAEAARLRLELKRLGQEKAEIAVDVSQLKDANRLAAVAAKRQEAMAKQTEKLDRARSKAAENHRREILNLSKESSELAKLEVAYSKLSRKKSQLEKEGMFTFGGWPGRTKDEELALRKVGAELDHVGTKIRSLGGDLDNLDRRDRFGSKILSWVSGLKEARIHLGFFSARLDTFAKSLAVFGPLVLSLTGGLSALVGVMGAGIVGAAAVGSAALGGFALTMGGVVFAGQKMVGHLKEQIKAAHDYRDAVLKYGKGSEQATTKLEQLQSITKGISPEAKKTVKGFASLREEWEKLTRPSRKPFFDIAADGLKTIKALMPEIADETNKTFDVLSSSLDPIFKELRGAGAESAISTLMTNFRKGLPSLIHGLAEFGKGMANISVEASRFLPQVTGGFNKWSETFAKETGTSKFKARLDEMIRQAGDLLHLFHVAGQAIVLFFGEGAEAGDEMVVTLSHTIERWNAWMRSVEGQDSLHSFFDQSARDTENFFSALTPLLRTFTELARALQPVTGGMLAFARALSEITTAIARIPGMTNILKGFGIVIGAAFVASKITKWSAAIRSAAVALGVLKAAEVGVAEAGAVAAVAPAAAGAGVAGGAASTAGTAAGAGAAGGALAKFGRGLGKVAVAAAAGYFVDEIGLEIAKGMGAGDPTEGQGIFKSLTHGFKNDNVAAIEERGLAEAIAQDKANKKILRGYHLLHSGVLASLGDIAVAAKRNSDTIAQTLPRGSSEARRKTAENMRATADAIKKAMDNGTVSVQRGTAKMRDLLHTARLVEGRDPLGLAKGFAESWREAGAINAKNRDRLIEDLRKMPPKARDEAYRFMMQFGKGLVRGKKIPEEDLRLFKSHAITEIQGIGGGFSSLNATIYSALKNIGDNLSTTLRSLGGKPPEFSLKQLRGMLPGKGSLPKVGSGLEQQQGGFTVPGSGSGDKVPKALPYGSFVMNREASKAYGFTSGGAVQTILEPKERVFLPNEVKAIGPHNLMAMNEAVPRQKGGGIGPMPIVQGRESAARRVGQLAVQKVYSAAEHYLQRHRPKTGAGGYGGPAFGPEGTSTYKGVLMATWVRQALEYGARHGSGDPQPTSGYRSHAQNVSEGRNYFSEHEKTQYPGGAVDFGGMVDPASLPLKMAVVNATKNFKYPLLAPAGFRDDGHASGTGHMLGGFALSTGGPAPPPGGMLVGASYYGGPSDSTSGTVGSSGVSLPGKMAFAELAMGKSLGGLPYHTKLKIGYSGKSVVAEKLDIGAGGGPVGGKNRAIDLWYETAQAIGMPGTAVVNVAPADGSAVSGGGHAALPKSVKVKHPVYVPGKGAISAGTKKTVESTVPLDVPDFGPLPTEEGAIRKELSELSHRTLPEYRAALRQHSKNKQIAEKLQASLKKIEGRIRELRDKLREIRLAKAKKRVSRKQSRQLGRITGQEGGIEAARRRYEERDQYASQVVAQEPEENGSVTEDWIERVFEPYVNNQERPAYESVLGAENDWRNAILTAENIAAGIEKNWETQIGYPERGRKPDLIDPNLHFPPRKKDQQATGLAGWIYGLHDQIERIRNFASSHSPKWWSEHPAAKSQRDGELRDLQTYFKPKLDFAMFRRKGLVSNLGEGRESFNYFAGTGSFEESLQDVQGLHWPDQHTKLGSLPGTPVPGVFGGAIWDTQEAIQDLGIRIQQAKESLSGSEPDRGAELKAFEEAIRGLAAGRPFVSINQGSPWLGAFAQGGVALVGERGPELAHLPHGTRIHDAEDTARLLEPNVVVDVSRLGYGPFATQGLSPGAPHGKVINVDQKNYFPTPPPDPHTWSKGNVFELEAMAS